MIFSIPKMGGILPDLQPGQLRELSGRDPRERVFPVVASLYLGTGLLVTGLQAGFGHLALWLAAALSAASVAALEWRVRRFIKVWGDDAGLVVTRSGDFEKIPWSDVDAIESGWGGLCRIRFRRDTLFGRTLKFPLARSDRWIGFDRPAAVWMRQRLVLTQGGLVPLPETRRGQ